jgi:hypothetical protein
LFEQNECERRTMMKKVLALVMVLSMAGFASAALQVDVAGGKADVNGTLVGDMYLILVAGNGTAVSNFALGAKAPDLSGFAATSSDFEAGFGLNFGGLSGEGWVMASSQNPYPLTGSFLSADISGFDAIQTVKNILVTQEPDKGGYWLVTTEWTRVFGGGTLALWTYDEVKAIGAKAFETARVDDTTSQELSRVWVPEPLTLSLLGLGALVLRRRS